MKATALKINFEIKMKKAQNQKPKTKFAKKTQIVDFS